MSQVSEKRAVVLVSGGLDSSTVLAMAKEQGYRCYALSFDYGQRHKVELQAADRIAQQMGAIEHKTVPIDLREIGGSALTDSTIDVPEEMVSGIPVTYVPARNLLFLSLALGWAEVIGAYDLFIGVNAVDYSGYPDCRPEFIESFEKTANLATKAGVEGGVFAVHPPLISLSKAEIIQQGVRLGLDYSMTVSCYQADQQGRGCGVCDSCRLRRSGFEDAKISDPTRYFG
ncbi:MAG: 7-cyano-7-deazaguanine synthase QueC [Gammaproteobacteria bacterium]|nr:7-cyano-7-deazaguanine synthase QueC [Gammaproteobacteria bacterium]